MKKIAFIAFMIMCGLTTALAQKPAEIKFDKLTHNFGTFSEKSPVVTYTFTYTNVYSGTVHPQLATAWLITNGCSPTLV